MNDFERAREVRIEENKRRMREMGITTLSEKLERATETRAPTQVRATIHISIRRSLAGTSPRRFSARLRASYRDRVGRGAALSSRARASRVVPSRRVVSRVAARASRRSVTRSQ
jgi:hypothetical protein